MDEIAVIQKLLRETEGPMARAEADLRAAQEKIDKIKAERYGLELVLARLGGDKAPRVEIRTLQETEGWRELGRSDAVERVLREAGKPLHRKEVAEILAQYGRRDALDHISAALAYLQRNHRARGKGSGMWVHPDHDRDNLLSMVKAVSAAVAATTTGARKADDPVTAGSSGYRNSPEGGDADDDGVDHHRGPVALT